MKKYLIRVNGTQYEVEVEEVRDGTGKSQVPDNSVNAAVSSPEPAAKKIMPEKSGTDTVPAGATAVNAPIPGTVLKINVSTGDFVKKGQILLVLEAMKMENEIAAPSDGRIASVNAVKGTSVNVGDVLVLIA